jgi:hypothetical protein
VAAVDGSQQGVGYYGKSISNEKDKSYIAAVKSIRVRILIVHFFYFFILTIVLCDALHDDIVDILLCIK